MGTWGVGAFENDDALDFVYVWQDDGSEAIRRALALGNGHVPVDRGQEAVVASTILAAAFARSAESLPDGAKELLARDGEQLRAQPRLLRAASKALERIAGADSELSALWAETSDAQLWKAQLRGLLRKLDAIKS